MRRNSSREAGADRKPWSHRPPDEWLTDDVTDILVGVAAIVIVALITLVF